MAKVIAPLMSFGASGKLANTLVFFPWKGIKAVRSYVIPANPRSPAQEDQRQNLIDAVELIHDAQKAITPLNELDVAAYNAWASIMPTPRTWFNQACANFIQQRVDDKLGGVFYNMSIVPDDEELDISLDFFDEGNGDAITAGNFVYGLTKTNLMFSEAALVSNKNASVTLTPLTNGVRYWFQFRATLAAGYVGVMSGIYTGVPAPAP